MGGNKDRLIFATKDPKVTSYANSQVGIAIMYINGNTIIMEKPSETTVLEMEKTARSKLDVSSTEKIVLNRIKETVDKDDKKGKRKKPQAPNPLSWKSKKVKVELESEEMHPKDENEVKRRRKKRTKVAPHARAAVEEKLKILMSAT